MSVKDGLGDSRALLLGGACCRDLPDIPSGGTLRLPDASGCCAQLFLPAATVHDLTRSGAYLATPGWLPDWRRHLSEWGFDQATARAFFSESCDRLVLLDTGVEPLAGGHLAEWAHYVDRPCETLEVGLDLLRASLSRAVLAWRAETAATPRADAGAMADAVLQLDIAGQLAELTTERAVVSGVFDVLEMLCAAGRLAYLAHRPDGSRPLWSRPAEPDNEPELRAALLVDARGHTPTPSGQGFALTVRSDSELLGTLLVDRVAMPSRLDEYLNVALHLLPTMALAITNARRYEQIIEERTRYRLARSTLDRVAEIALWVAPDLQIVDANQAACAALGYTAAELMALPVTQIDPRYTADRSLDLWSRAIHGGSVAWTSIYHAKDGQRVEVEVTASVVEQGSGALLCTLARDIGERRRAEALERQMDERLRQAQQAAGLGVLAGGLAHDFNNLLASVMAEAELALGEPAGAPASLSRIVDAAHRGADLCRMMLACSGRAPVAEQPTDLAATVRAGLERLSPDLPSTVALTISAPGAGPRVAGDPGQLAEVLTSLVNNAVEALAGTPGEVAVSVSAARREAAELGLNQAGRPLPAGDYALLVVRDSGCGMDSATLARAFDPFFTTKFTGRGLGLAAVQGIVWAHGGAIKVSTQPGVGTTVTVALPVLAASTSGQAGAGEWQAGGMVLLADDDDRVRRVSARVLTHLGFEVVSADDGNDAMRLFGLHCDQVRLAILDVMMPGVTGVDALAGMRRVQPGLPALLMSGHSEIDLSSTPPSSAPTAFLAKPFSQERLRQALAQVLGEAD